MEFKIIHVGNVLFDRLEKGNFEVVIHTGFYFGLSTELGGYESPLSKRETTDIRYVVDGEWFYSKEEAEAYAIKDLVI